MIHPAALARIQALKAYSPGLSIDEIRRKYNLNRVIKLASNENPLGASPLAQRAIIDNAGLVFRYPRGGNPELVSALADWHNVSKDRIVTGNGSDEIIDVLIRIVAYPGIHNIVCFDPCFSIYPIQSAINGVETRRLPLNADFSFNSDGLLELVDDNTRLVFITTPDNPSGYCPPKEEVEKFADNLALKAPAALLVIDEAYMDFSDNEKAYSLLANHILTPRIAYLRTFSKSRGLAGLRLGYGVLPENIGDCYWRARLPFSVNILAEKAGIAALQDQMFYEKVLNTVKVGREFLTGALQELGCLVWPSQTNFLMFQMPPDSISARECFEALLKKGIIIRHLKSYGLPDYLRVSVGNEEENKIFLSTLAKILSKGNAHA